MIPLNADKVIRVVQSTIYPHLLAKQLNKGSKTAVWLRLASVHDANNHNQNHLSVKLQPFASMSEGVKDQIGSVLLDTHHSEEEGEEQMHKLFDAAFTLPPDTQSEQYNILQTKYDYFDCNNWSSNSLESSQQYQDYVPGRN